MKEEFVKYMQAIGITDIMRQRVEGLLSVYEMICPESITAMFLADYIKEDGAREFQSVWFFSAHYTMETKNIAGEDNFDITPLHKNIVYIKIKDEDYDFKKAKLTSRCHVSFRIGPAQIAGELKASRENCDYLKQILLQHIIPNLIQ